MKIAWGLLLAIVCVSLLSGSAAAGGKPAPQPTKIPVILVHGYKGNASNWNTMKAELQADGHWVYAPQLPSEDNVQNAQFLMDLIGKVKTATGFSEVCLVGHSMGGLSSRYAIKILGAPTHCYSSIDTPQQGASNACLLPYSSGGQMCPGSAFLTELNSGADLPSGVDALTFQNLQTDWTSGGIDGTSCSFTVDAKHITLPKNATVISAVKAFVNGVTCPTPGVLVARSIT